MSAIHINNIKGAYMGSTAYSAVYVGENLIYPTTECYAVADYVTGYTGDYPWLWVISENCWYHRNNADTYEKYGVYATTTASTETQYRGKLAIVDGYEYKSNGTSWTNIGELVSHDWTVNKGGWTETTSTLSGYTKYYKDSSTSYSLTLTADTDGTDSTVFMQLWSYNSAYKTYCTIKKNGTQVYTTTINAGTYDKTYNLGTFSKGDVFTIIGGCNYAQGHWNAVSFSPYKAAPVDYKQKDAPELIMIFDTVEEMNEYGCVYENMLAQVGSSLYIYHNGVWGDIKDDQKILYTTTDNNTISNYISGAANIMIDGQGMYIFTSAPTSLPSNAFAGATTLSTVTLPTGITQYSDNLFSGCTSLTSVVANNDITYIGDRVFAGCTKLASFSMGDVTVIGEWALSGCSSLSAFTFPESLVNVGDGALAGTGIKEFVWPSAFTEINGYMFENCKSLTSITIPEGVLNLGGYCLAGCSALPEITLPSSLAGLGNGHIFDGCSALTAITVPDGIKGLGGYCFANCKKLESIEIPSTITIMGAGAFQNCTALTAITIPDAVTSINSSTFQNCQKLTEITIHTGITSIGSYGFSGCIGLSSVTIPDSVKSMGDYAFTGCTSLVELNLGTGMTTIPFYCFRGCSKLASLTLPEGYTYVDTTAFGDCTSLTAITFPSTFTKIADWAFAGCSNLIKIESNATTAPTLGGSNVFKGAHSNGTLFYPAGSSYSSWLATGTYYLGYYNWTGEEIS